MDAPSEAQQKWDLLKWWNGALTLIQILYLQYFKEFLSSIYLYFNINVLN